MKRWLGVAAVAAGMMAIATVTVSAFTLVVAHTQRGLVYKVNQQHAHQLIGFVTELERTYGPIKHLGCYARWGHVPMSLHHTGNACDIEQTGWGRTSYRAMYGVSGLAHRWGLRDGCSFGDCGHIDVGGYSWANGGPPGFVAAAEIPATAADRGERHLASGEWPIPRVLPAQATVETVKLASTETIPVPHRKHVALRKVRHHRQYAYIWRAVDDGDRCVDLGRRKLCVTREKVRLRG